MHRPPAVSRRVERSRWHLGAIVVLWVLGASVLAAFAVSQTMRPLHLLLGFVLAGAGLSALSAWWRAPSGLLQWDGQSWHWSGFEDDPVVQLRPVFDCQFLVLVKLRSESGSVVWLWLSAVASHAAWLALRRAVFGAPRQSDSSPSGEPWFSEPLDGGRL